MLDGGSMWFIIWQVFIIGYVFYVSGQSGPCGFVGFSGFGWLGLSGVHWWVVFWVIVIHGFRS